MRKSNPSVSVPICNCQFNNGEITFKSVADTGDKDNNFDAIDYYFISPEDEEEILFYSWTVELNGSRRRDGQEIDIDVKGDQNTDRILSLVKKYGLRPYTLSVKPLIGGDSEWDGTKTLTSPAVQFTDVIPGLTTEASDTLPVQISVKGKWWNNDCMTLVVQSSVQSKTYPVTFTWNESDQVWTGIASVSLDNAVCHEKVTLSLVGQYKESGTCTALPCSAWDYNQQLEQTFSGGCMNTGYQTGLHILHDIAGDDLPCSIAKSTESGHLITTYTSLRNTRNRSVYTSIIRGSNGALSPSSLVPDVTDNDQYDADVAPVKGTDDFFVVWTSNAASTNKRIYGRRFTISSTGTVEPKGVATQISQQNGDYVAPRVVYNNKVDRFFVTWISVADKEVQSIYLDNTDSPKPTTYQGGFTGEISTEYYSGTLDLHNNDHLNISLFNAKDKVIAAYKNTDGNVSIFQYTYVSGKTPTAEKLTTYEVSNLLTFHMAFDDINSKLKIVFSVSRIKEIYGDTLDYFSDSNSVRLAGNPVRLNQGDYSCFRPFIKRTPNFVDGDNKRQRNFVVAWETDTHSVFYNVFDYNYSQLTSETETNKGDDSSDNPRVVVTDNQIAIVFQAKKYDGSALSGIGLLYYVANRTDV